MKNSYILFKEKNTQHRINVNSLLFVRTSGHAARLYTGHCMYNVKVSMQELLEDPDFTCLVRIHRCFAVNIHQVTAINRTELFIDHIRLPISRSYSQNAQDAFFNTT